MKDLDTEHLSGKEPCKKIYHQPELHVYGKLRDITQHLGASGVSDGLAVPPNKTSA
jgi:hypothetical protein